MRTIIYVDALNLYYGTLEQTSYKWLDLHALSAKRSFTLYAHTR